MPILKPESCKGCPFYPLSKYITPDKIVENSTISLLAQAPGAHEENGSRLVGYDYSFGKRQERVERVRPQPLIGASGNWLRKEFWPLTKINFNSISLHNVIKCRPYNSNDLPNIGSNKTVNGITVKMLKEAISYCSRKYLKFPEKTETVMAMGEISLYALTGEELLKYKTKYNEYDETTGKKIEKTSTISEWRGWVLGCNKIKHTLEGLHEYYNPINNTETLNIFPVMHIASLFQSDKYYHATLLDFVRFGKFIRKEWPSSLPQLTVNDIPEMVPSVIGFDTEYREIEGSNKTELTMWSLADTEHNVYVVDAEYSRTLQNLPQRLTVVTQNGVVDYLHLIALLSEVIDFPSELIIEDCMLANTVLWTGELNSLDYQLSKCGEYNRHKHLRESNDPNTKYLYAGIDADTTLNSAWKDHVLNFQKDQLAYKEYVLRRRPLINIITKFNEKGILVYKDRVELITRILDQKIDEINKRAIEITGNANFNIRSYDMLKAALYSNNFNYKTKTKPKKVSLKKKANLLLEELKAKYGT